MIAAVVFLTVAAAFYGRWTWQNYWILKDGLQGIAHVTDEGGHDSIYYTYSVQGVTYTGHGHRDYRDPRYNHVIAGGTSIVWYSASHPWISSPRRPDAVLIGLPWIVVVTALDVMILFGLIKSSRR